MKLFLAGIAIFFLLVGAGLYAGEQAECAQCVQYAQPACAVAPAVGCAGQAVSCAGRARPLRRWAQRRMDRIESRRSVRRARLGCG